ncbi:MAG: hypothetical protein Q9P01_20370 [Anaerolineae bacterium]|nr:hypothetical protein [Anaerolineae bacterium]MDQ7037106.1 hypothetical protein [Anaerolineae bacterium]
MVKRSIFLLLLFILSIPLQAQDELDLTWTREILGEGIKPALAVDANDIVHAAYITEEQMGGVFYVTNASGNWETSTVSQGYFYGPLDVAVSPEGQPFIAYHDHQSERFDQELGDEVVAILADGEWVLNTIEDAGHDGWDNSIAVDNNGFWHTASIDPVQFNPNSNGAEYATNAYSDDGSYTVENIPQGAQPYEFATSIAVADDGTAGVTYWDSEGQDLIYAERSLGIDGEWLQEVVDSDGDVGRYAALVFDADSNPHIAYYLSEGRSGTIRYGWRNNDNEWNIEDVGIIENLQSGMNPGAARKITSLAMDSEGQVHIVYSDNLKLMYAVRGIDGTWSQQQILNGQDEQALLGTLVEIALDSNDNPHIITYIVRQQRPLQAEILYLTTEN